MPKCNSGEIRMTETPAEKQFPASSAVLSWFQMVYYSLLHLSYILLTTAISFKFVAAKHDLSSVRHRASDLCCVVSDCSLWPFLSLFDRLHLHVRGLTFSSTNIHAYSRSHIHVRLYWQCFKRLQPWYSSQITQILNHCLNLWSPATRFLESRHGNLKSGLPWGNRDVRCENDFEELKKQWFGPLLRTVCVEF